MADNENTPRQQRVEKLVEQGHSLAHSVGVAWAEQGENFTPPKEHGADEPGTRREGHH
jgi:hypothetical protein